MSGKPDTMRSKNVRPNGTSRNEKQKTNKQKTLTEQNIRCHKHKLALQKKRLVNLKTCKEIITRYFPFF